MEKNTCNCLYRLNLFNYTSRSVIVTIISIISILNENNNFDIQIKRTPLPRTRRSSRKFSRRDQCQTFSGTRVYFVNLSVKIKTAAFSSLGRHLFALDTFQRFDEAAVSSKSACVHASERFRFFKTRISFFSPPPPETRDSPSRSPSLVRKAAWPSATSTHVRLRITTVLTSSLSTPLYGQSIATTRTCLVPGNQ